MLIITFLFSAAFLIHPSLSTTNGGGVHQLIVVNNCKESIWPGIQGGAGHPTPRDGGFLLTRGQEVVIDVPQKWSGRVWGRQGCNFDASGKGSCATGDCSGQLRCRGKGGVPPTTVVEMTLGSSSSALHFYECELGRWLQFAHLDEARRGGIGCGVASCDVDLNTCCPAALELRAGGRVVGCKSACLAMQSAKYCCTGEYSNPRSCRPTLFAHLFKAICPRAYSYAFDDTSSLNRCRASRYLITFCPAK
ncbi:Pathogenesis-related thaumatin superfamily protein [Perilla frutescens var. frutescens]|nr:Pathogenesis-related thaumatin superfamily protein [Perilla frutescens var. frutescens]